ncbi:endonuclease/exonuclease/phosphatase family protein [Endozoicomonas sp. G2_1]|uniref:endonuclease/exonuclease/phosphatase family protein n=1 Tax=Endozoicomonas sp. G2_1 TaxID=2821091 RepID=UPI001ADACDCC|nr:endonuclease/exonuclease/phosphatase family protein [Endozoicomonas sp. G2_1]MBO9492268.1 endonuclease/exonuclease/phosphatase family protein [Endozoicomonas sp. G2_1]
MNKKISLFSLSLLAAGCSIENTGQLASDTMTTESVKTQTIKVATFNVSMEALNYLPYDPTRKTLAQGPELITALRSNRQQIKNIAEIIQRTNPDIILLNEFDRSDDFAQSLKIFKEQYLAVSQNGQAPIEFPYSYQGPVNTGVKAPFDFNNNQIKGELPADTYGFGHFAGHFGMVLLSKYPINQKQIRTFQQFKWQDMPGALEPVEPSTNQPWYNKEAWQNFRLSSKSHWDIPVNVDGKLVHILASHPTPPVFDGPEDRNGKRNHDEIRFWRDYLNGEQASYIYDDKNQYGGLENDQAFVILGDLNASADEGDAINSSIAALINHTKIQDAKPSSLGGVASDKKNSPFAQYHTAHWGMRADYVLPSKVGFTIKDSGIFWPEPSDEGFRLVKDRQASSDHRLVWLELTLENK